MGILYQTESFLTACSSLVTVWCMSQTSRDRNNNRRWNCSPIGHNNTEHFLCPIRSRHLREFLEIARWGSVPRGFFDRTWKLSLHPFSRHDWLLLGLRGWWRLESLTVCRCLYKGSTFSSVILRPWVLVRPGLEPAASDSTNRCLPNWANRAA